MQYCRTTRFLLLAATALWVAPAFATDKVSSPNVEKDKLELEYRGGYDMDDNAALDRKELNKFIVNYGVTDRLRPELKMIVANDPHRDAKINSWEAGLRYQFWKKEEAWVAAATEGNFKFSSDGKADRFEWKFLLAKTLGQWEHRLNIGTETEYGGSSRSGLSLKAGWKTTYLWLPYFNPGFEIYADTGRFRDELSLNEQKWQAGPVFTGNITEHVKYDAGYLFGLSDPATDGRIKLILTYSQKF